MRIPAFTRIETMVGLYRLPSGRIAELVRPIEFGHKCATLKYLDNGEEITVYKRWLAANAVVV